MLYGIWQCWTGCEQMKKRKKVLFVTHGADLYGSNKSLVDMLISLKRMIDPIVLMPESGALDSVLEKKKIKKLVLPFSCNHGGGVVSQERQDRQFLENCEKAIEIAKIIVNEKIDIVHSNSSICDVGAMAAAIAGVPHVWHIRESIEKGVNSFYWNENYKRILFGDAKRIITISKWLKNDFDSRYGVNSEVLYDVISSKTCDCYFDRNSNRSFVIVGNIEDYKGQWDAIKAVRVLRDEQGISVKLFLVGGARSKEYEWVINKYIEKHGLQGDIFIFPFVYDVLAIRKKCPYAIVSSKNEALGRATVEAFLSKQLVIGSSSGATKELIGDDGSRGLLYEAGNYKELARCMNRAINLSKEEFYSITSYACEYINTELNSEVFNKRLIEIYEECSNPESQLSSTRKTVDEMYKKINEIASADYSKDLLVAAKWLRFERDGSLSTVLRENNLRNVAIYGMGKFGKKLYDSLAGSEITIMYLIDKNPCRLSELETVVGSDEELENIDVLIVTVSKEEQELVKHFSANSRGGYRVIGISELLGLGLK